MNISPDGDTVRVHTEPEVLFIAEKTGVKPNTVRIIDANEKRQLKETTPKTIIIQFQQEIIIRTITHVYVSEMILGKYLAIFSWTNEAHHHVITASSKDDPLAHNMRIDPVELENDTSKSVILLPMSLIHKLIALSGDGSLPTLLERMIKTYTTPPHCHPPAWTIGDEDRRNENGT